MLSPRARVEAGRRWWAQTLVGRGVTRIRELDLDTHALALCAQQVLCTAPLVVAISAVSQRVAGRDISYFITRFFGLHDASAHDVANLFGRSVPSISTGALIFAMLTAIAFTTSVAAVQQRGFEMIWTLPRIQGVRSYLRQLVWTPGLAMFCLAVLLANRAGRWIDGHVVGIGAWAIYTLQGVATFLFYWWTQHWLLRGRVSWRALMPGALAVGIVSVAMVRLSRMIMPPQISWQVHAYGEIGAVFVLSVWLMVASVVIFGGVLLGALIAEKRDAPKAQDPSPGVPPLTDRGLDSAAAAQQQTDVGAPPATDGVPPEVPAVGG